jgi:hypothetical protein
MTGDADYDEVYDEISNDPYLSVTSVDLMKIFQLNLLFK